MPSIPSENLAVAVKKYAKTDTKVFYSPVQFYLISLICSKYFVRVVAFIGFLYSSDSQWNDGKPLLSGLREIIKCLKVVLALLLIN